MRFLSEASSPFSASSASSRLRFGSELRAAGVVDVVAGGVRGDWKVLGPGATNGG